METYPKDPTENHLVFNFTSTGVDIDKVIRHANQSINMEPRMEDARKYCNVELNYDIIGDYAKLFIIDHNTTQGVVLGEADENLMRIVIPALSSEADIAYAFQLLKALTELYPNISIKKADAISDFTDKGIAQAIAHCRNNMRCYLMDIPVYEDGIIVDDDDDDDDIIVDTYARGYNIRTELTMEMLQKLNSIEGEHTDSQVMERIIDAAFSTLCRLQWLSTVLLHADHPMVPKLPLVRIIEAEVPLLTDDDDDDDDDDDLIYFDDGAIVKNCNLFVDAKYTDIILYIDGKYKYVKKEDFFKAALRNPNIEVLTDEQFALSQMTHEEWANFCHSIPGRVADPPKTFIMRWNPAISDFTRMRYNHYLHKANWEFSLNWSIYDWQQAKVGDRCYMLLEGSPQEHPGIIFKGMIDSEPYVGKDWRGTDKYGRVTDHDRRVTSEERHYVELIGENAADINKRPWITLEELEAAIPDFNWRSGRSGQPLTPEQAEKLEQLWDSVRTEIENQKRNNNGN